MKTSLRYFYLFWISQFFSTLASSMTTYALGLWIYAKTGSAFSMSLLTFAGMIPSLFAVFAGPLADRFSRKKMILLCDGIAGSCTLLLLGLLCAGCLQLWMLYGLCFLSALCNTFQSPAADAAVSMLVNRDEYGKTAGIRAFSWSLQSFLAPAAAGFLYLSFGLSSVILFDIATCLCAMLVLYFLIPLPQNSIPMQTDMKYGLMMQQAWKWLKEHPLILYMIFYMALVNLINEVYSTALPVLVINQTFGSEGLYSLMKAAGGLSMCLSGALMMTGKASKKPVRTITMCILVSFGLENVLLAFGKSAWIYITAEIIGWASIPIMNAALDFFYRSKIPENMQGRIFSLRNTIQFSLIPFASIGTGYLLDSVLEPWTSQAPGWFHVLFGTGKSCAAACLLFLVAVFGAVISLIACRKMESL